MPSFLTKLKDRLKKTQDAISNRVDDLLKYYKNIDDDFFEELEEVLISADLGVDLSLEIVEDVKDKLKSSKTGDVDAIHRILRNEIAGKMESSEEKIKTPAVILMIGVNGTGKTTTAAKLASLFKQNGKSVMLCAADTFRAAAIDQLKTWAERVDVPIIAQVEGADPAAVVHDAIGAAKARNADVLICDTAGRLHNKKNLMNELEKINRIAAKNWPEAAIYSYLVIDATTGQNALMQVKLFGEKCELSGIVVTKLDGTAKGGAVVAARKMTGLPVVYIGVGEGVDDLLPFDAEEFAAAII
jgi:fused signal recognition particle receptor